MDFVAPPLLGYAGGAGLLEYTGGAGTENDPIMFSSSESEDDLGSEGEPEPPRVLPTTVPVIELKDVRIRHNSRGIGYDRDLKMLNFSVPNSKGYIIFQNIKRKIVERDAAGNHVTTPIAPHRKTSF
eukprot:COSAG06_NODE_130_length_22547_cov_24.796418_5_plen_127_part_00